MDPTTARLGMGWRFRFGGEMPPPVLLGRAVYYAALDTIADCDIMFLEF